jgi:lipid-A-disaccharide synthase
MVIAGEISSDNHGSKLIQELKKIDAVRVTAIGGDKMGDVADGIEENIVSKAAVGFSEVIKLIPYFINLKKRIANKYFNPDSVDLIDGLVLIDYPGFNMRIAKIAKEYNIPVFYYITPQVWAWGKGRIKVLSEICKKLYCLFEFEKELFKEAGANVDFVGHPLLEDMPDNYDVEEFNSSLNLSENESVVALLPGSRISEVKRHLPVMIESVKDLNYRLILGKASSVPEELIKSIAGDIQLTSDVHTLLKRAEMAIVSSGTSTLETAVIGTPFVTVYRVARLSYFIAKMLVDIEYISMVNILAGKEVVPELIQKDLTAENLKKETDKILSSEDVRDMMKKELNDVAEKIGTFGASARTAKSILEELTRILQ